MFSGGMVSTQEDEDDEYDEIEYVAIEDDYVENELKLKQCMEYTLQQLIHNSEHFPFGAYLLELERLYEIYNNDNIFKPQEFVISTLFIMIEGNFGDLCPSNNTFLQNYLINQTELKKVGLNNKLITIGKQRWSEKIGKLNNDDDEDFVTFSSKKKMNDPFKNHKDIIKTYDVLHKNDKLFKLVL
jgi:hypothetical protein